MPKKKPSPDTTTRVLRLRLKDKHVPALRAMAGSVNLVWNYCNDLGTQVFDRERRFLSGFDFQAYLNGASKEGLNIGSAVFQQVAEEFATRRKQFKKVKLRGRVSNPERSNYSLGWIPFKARSLSYKAGHVGFQGLKLSLWDSYGLADYVLGSGNICEDARSRWYLNICVEVKKTPKDTTLETAEAVGLDLGLKDFLATSDELAFEAQRLYRGIEPKLAVAQRAGKKDRAAALHAKARNKRRDFQHKLSTALVRKHLAIFVGNVNASAHARTRMAKSVHDAGWSAFRTMLQYKCDGAGVWFKEIDEKYSTQDCNVCGTRAGPMGLAGLSVRQWSCHCCGTLHDRDVNAARNIKMRGMLWLEEQFSAADSALPESAAAVNKDSGAAAPWPRQDIAV